MADNDQTPPAPSAPTGNCWPTSRSSNSFVMNISMNIFILQTITINTSIKTCDGDSEKPPNTSRPTILETTRWTYRMTFSKDIQTGNWSTDVNAYTTAFNAAVAEYQSQAGTETKTIENSIKNRVCQPERKCKGRIISAEVRKDCGMIKTKTTTKSVGTGGFSASGSGGNCRFD